MQRDLIDPEDGENRAVRAFLLGYQIGNDILDMKLHMQRSGFPLWPAWVETERGHLSKGGAQSWLRHLFAQEPLPQAASAPAAEPVAAQAPLIVDVYRAEGDDPFICAVRGKATIEVLTQIETAIREHADFGKGDGVYRFEPTWFAGQFGEYGQCELRPGWGFDEVGYEAPGQESHPQAQVVAKSENRHHATLTIVRKSTCIVVCDGREVLGSFVGPGAERNAETFRAALVAPAHFDGYLCRAWGETELPCAEVVRDMAGVRRFIVREWLGDENDPDLPKIMEGIDADLEREKAWYAQFEIGGASVEPVYSMWPALPPPEQPHGKEGAP